MSESEKFDFARVAQEATGINNAQSAVKAAFHAQFLPFVEVLNDLATQVSTSRYNGQVLDCTFETKAVGADRIVTRLAINEADRSQVKIDETASEGITEVPETKDRKHEFVITLEATMGTRQGVLAVTGFKLDVVLPYDHILTNKIQFVMTQKGFGAVDSDGKIKEGEIPTGFLSGKHHVKVDYRVDLARGLMFKQPSLNKEAQPQLFALEVLYMAMGACAAAGQLPFTRAALSEHESKMRHGAARTLRMIS